MSSFCKENNKFVGISNYLAGKKRIYLILMENEVIEYVKGSISKPPQDQSQALSMYMEGEIRAQRIHIESIKDSLILYVAKLKTSKKIYDKLVELFSVSIVGEIISLRTKLYKMKVSREEGVASYFMKVSQIRDQLQELGEIILDPKMTTLVLNALRDEWGNFVSSIYGKKEATPFSDLWSLCNIEETILEAKNDVGSNEQTQAYATMTKKKGKFGKFKPWKRFQKKIDLSKIRCYECMNMGISKGIVLNSRRTTRKERKKTKPMSPKK